MRVDEWGFWVLVGVAEFTKIYKFTNFLHFVVFQLLFFLLIVQVVYFYKDYQVLQDFFLLSILCVSLEISIGLGEIYKLYGLDLIFV